jgi:hypothetical protein
MKPIRIVRLSIILVFSILLTAFSSAGNRNDGYCKSFYPSEILKTNYIQYANQDPVLKELPDITISKKDSLLILVEADDPDEGDELTFSLLNGPQGMFLNGKKGLLFYFPQPDQSGEYTVTVRVDDSNGGFDTKSFKLTVIEADMTTDYIIVRTNHTLKAGSKLEFNVGISSDKADLSIKAAGIPEGALFDENAKAFTWTPDETQIGTYLVVFSLYESSGSGPVLKGAIPVRIVVTSEFNQPLNVTSKKILYVMEQFTYTTGVSVRSDSLENGVVTVENLPEGAVYDENYGVFIWTPSVVQAGDYVIIFKLYRDSVSESNFVRSLELKVTVLADVHVQLTVPRSINVQTSGTVAFTVQMQKKNEVQASIQVRADSLPQGAVFDGNSLEFSWIPAAEQTGIHIVKFKVYDHSASPAKLLVSEEVKIVVTDENFTWNVDSTAYDNSMQLNARVVGNAGLTIESGDILGAFVSDKCRGIAPAIYTPEINDYAFDLVIYSNLNSDNEIVSFKTYKKTSQKVFNVNENITFKSNDVVNCILSLNTVTGIMKNRPEFKITDKFKLYSNYPNPFNPVTTIKFEIVTSSKVKLSIYNVTGVLVKTIVSDYLPASVYTYKWDGTDNSGVKVASGIYIYSLRVGNMVTAKRMILMK